MNRVKATASVSFAARDTAPPTGSPQYFTVGVPGSQPATVLPGYYMNMTMDELMSIVTAAGMTPDDTNWNQVWQGIFRSITFNDTGAANAMTIALPAGLTFPAGALGLGTTFHVRAAANNTGATTFAPFGLSALPVARLDTGVALTAGDILAGSIYTLTLDPFRNAWALMTLNPSTIIAASAIYKPTIYTFDTPGAWNWTVPAGIQRARFRLWGGGGGGGGVTDPGAGSGGGGGAYGEVALSLIPGATYSGVVGAGGAQGTPGADGGAGGATTLTAGAGYSAGGGLGGHSANNNALNSVAGGSPSGLFDYSHIGQSSGGGVAGYRAGPDILFYGGIGGLSQYGGYGGQAGTSGGNPGGSPGGGGGGSASSGGSPGNGNGGAGAAGRVEISI